MIVPLLLQCSTRANMYDVIDAVDAFVAPPECISGCLNWTTALNASLQAASFVDPSLLAALGSKCAFPGKALHGSFAQGRSGTILSAMEKAAFYGPICPCRTSATAIDFRTCIAPLHAPTQINLQLANSTTVVASFVTHETSPPTLPPLARLRLSNVTDSWYNLTGVSHWYETSHTNHSNITHGALGLGGWRNTSCIGPLPNGGPRNSNKCEVRNITMHFVRFPNLVPRQSYTYQVRTGMSTSAWSKPYTFRAPYGQGAKSGGSSATRVAIYGGASLLAMDCVVVASLYGCFLFSSLIAHFSALSSHPLSLSTIVVVSDMGNNVGNCYENLRAGCASGAIDAIVHMGDHAYDMGAGDDYHGDAYMQAFQGALATCPWLPVIGNHESTQGHGGDRVDWSTQERYLNQTWGVIYGEDGAESETSTARTTATTSLGHLLTRSSFYGAGAHGAAPSRTSQWYSLDLGLIHFVILDLDVGQVGAPAVFSGTQAAWAAADLAAADANRANVPWVVVTSHFPLYSATFLDGECFKTTATAVHFMRILLTI